MNAGQNCSVQEVKEGGGMEDATASHRFAGPGECADDQSDSRFVRPESLGVNRQLAEPGWLALRCWKRA